MGTLIVKVARSHYEANHSDGNESQSAGEATTKERPAIPSTGVSEEVYTLRKHRKLICHNT